MAEWGGRVQDGGARDDGVRRAGVGWGLTRDDGFGGEAEWDEQGERERLE